MFIDIPLGFIVLVVQKLCICIFLYILYCVILYQWPTVYSICTWTLYCRSLFLKWEC